MPKPPAERRRHPRLKANLPLVIRHLEFDTTAITTDISCLGAYCRLDRYIEPMTKLKIDFRLPLETKNGRVERAVKCQGVVVRVDKSLDNTYSIGIYFNRITERCMQTIAQYVNQHLSAPEHETRQIPA